MHVQATTPETIGLAVAESPVGQLAWIADKFQRWSDPQQPLTDKFTADDIITNVMMYWASDSFTSAARLYKEAFQSGDVLHAVLGQVAVPVAVALYPHELWPPPTLFVREKYKRLLDVEDMQEGGHFAALETPHLLHRQFARFAAQLQQPHDAALDKGRQSRLAKIHERQRKHEATKRRAADKAEL